MRGRRRPVNSSWKPDPVREERAVDREREVCSLCQPRRGRHSTQVFADPLLFGRKLDEVFKKYAPATDDNDPDHYIVLLKKFGGLDSTRTIGSLTDAELGKLIGAIEREMKPYVFTLPMLLASADLFWARSLFVVLRV
jgi:hypothetical protein